MSGKPKYREAMYNVVSFRVSQKELEQIDALKGDKSRGSVLRKGLKIVLQTSGNSEPLC